MRYDSIILHSLACDEVGAKHISMLNHWFTVVAEYGRSRVYLLEGRALEPSLAYPVLVSVWPLAALAIRIGFSSLVLCWGYPMQISRVKSFHFITHLRLSNDFCIVLDLPSQLG